MTTTDTSAEAVTRSPVAVEVERVARTVQRRRGGPLTLIEDVSFDVPPGTLVGIAGGSGAGKTTLLATMAGVVPPSGGMVRYNGDDLYAYLDSYRSEIGYVPQDDIVHRALSTRRTLEYAARLRMPAGTPASVRDARIDDVLDALHLAAQAGTRVGSLSGGQRKRVSIGVEMLTDPTVFFLDEPTSGLDPATGRDLMRELRGLAGRGHTVVLTTHAPQDLLLCDEVVFLARGGHLVFQGTPEEALKYFAVDHVDAIYERLEREASPAEWATRFAVTRGGYGRATHSHEAGARPEQPRLPGLFSQWRVLAERNVEVLRRDLLTLAILLGAPVMVVAMFAILFQPGAFDLAQPSPGAAVMILFWLAFGAFFFGLTYGLLEICTEFPIFYRERLVNLGVAPYVLSKLVVLLPIFAAVVAIMLGVLLLLDRIPSGDGRLYAEVSVTLLISGAAAIALGLLASASVSRPEQAALVLPMLCFPQVLFSGAILPVPVMAAVGQWLSYVTSARWTFEALGGSLGMNRLFAEGNSPLGPALLAEYGDTFSGTVAVNWLILAAFMGVALVATCLVLQRKSRPAGT